MKFFKANLSSKIYYSLKTKIIIIKAIKMKKLGFNN